MVTVRNRRDPSPLSLWRAGLRSGVVGSLPNRKPASDPRQQEEFEWENYLDTQYKPPQGVSGGTEEIMNYENLISTTTSLHDHLMWQVGLGGFNDEEQHLLAILISYVDE